MTFPGGATIIVDRKQGMTILNGDCPLSIVPGRFLDAWFQRLPDAKAKEFYPSDSSPGHVTNPALERANAMQQRTRELLSIWTRLIGSPMSVGLLRSLSPTGLFSSRHGRRQSNAAVRSRGRITRWNSGTSSTSHLHDHARDRYRCWNQIVDEVKAASSLMLERKIGPIVKDHALPEIVGHSVRWDVLGACMESEYADICPTAFFTDLMGWYKRGRFPCGWGGVDRSGKIRLAETEHDGPVLVTRALNFPLLEPPITLPKGKLIIF